MSKIISALTGESVPQRAPISGSTRFQKGHEKKGGRTKGGPNNVSREYKEAILDGLAKYGEDGKGKGGLEGYVTLVARRNLRSAAMLLLAVLVLEEKAHKAIRTRPPM